MHIHIQVTVNDTIRELVEVPVSNIRTAPGTMGGIWIDYDGVTIQVYHKDNITTTNPMEKPSSPTAMATVSLAGLFRDTSLFFGFAAGTWNQGDTQDIVAWSFNP